MFGDINDFARHTGWLHGTMLGFASYGVVFFAVLLVAGWWVARSRSARAMAAAVWAGVGTLLAVAANQPLVNGFQEARPYTVQPHGLLVLATPSADFSFPSDHAVMAGAVAGGLWLVDRRLGVTATVAALLMSFARVYIAAHYPHDVLVGLAFGAALTLVGWLVIARPLTWLVAKLTDTRLRPLFARFSSGKDALAGETAHAPTTPGNGTVSRRSRRRRTPAPSGSGRPRSPDNSP